MCARDKTNESLRPFAPEAGKFANGAKTSKIVQFYRLKQKHSLIKKDAPKEVTKYRPDWLASMTAHSKACMDVGKKIYSNFEKSSILRRFPSSKTLTPFIIPTTLLILATILTTKHLDESTYPRNKLWIVFYLASFAIHFGAQIWMTFVSGLVLYFSLPRHVFGLVQERLFPFFYMFNAVMSFIQIISYINTQSIISLNSKPMIQILVMTLSLVIEMYIKLYVANQIVLLKHKKTMIEAEAGSGQEIGQHILGELANCPHYMSILRKFRRLHSYTSIATIITVICSIYHINYLTDKLCI